MKERNGQLKSTLGGMATRERLEEVASIPAENTVNRQGYAAYSLDDELRLITMLNTLKIQPQYYRSENETISELRELVEKIGMKDPYFLAQCIVYSRCMGEGMRSINHLAATLAAPFVSGNEWAKRFYGAFDKKNQKGGCVFRLDDMMEMKSVWEALNTVNGKMMALPNAMKKGFASVLENTDANILAKYKKTVIDIANLVHPNSKVSKATFLQNGEVVKVLDAIMSGVTVSADTWETQNSEAGQEVAKAVRAGKITKDEGEKILAEAKADNWEGLLADGKLGVLAALRNIRNIMKNPRKQMINDWCNLITDSVKVRKALILPVHFDLAYMVVDKEFNNYDYANQVKDALLRGYENAIPNLKEALPGRTCVIVDCSGSMGSYGVGDGKTSSGYSWTRINNTDSCAYKAGLIAATIAKATKADVIQFGSSARYVNVEYNKNVFSLAKELGLANQGCTYPNTAFDLMTQMHKAYDRIIFISDNEVNSYNLTSGSYKNYLRSVCSPYIYAVDLAAYGTTPLAGDKISYYYGYGSMLYEDIANKEFNPNMHIEKIRKVVI